ncbi:hypothetical protein ABZV14_06035 [Streptosporangium canum]|uniref:hypothetical protein n=1 Tax=Streptosporangium canum TaxID=324952 RepID=UPI0033BCC445
MIRNMEDPLNLAALAPIDRVTYLARLQATMREAHALLGLNLQAALAVAVSTDLEATARALGVPPAIVVRMAVDPNTPDVALLLRGLNAARHRPELSVDSICDIRDALAINGSSDQEIKEIARLLNRVAKQDPLEGATWADADPNERSRFAQAVIYAQSLIVR